MENGCAFGKVLEERLSNLESIVKEKVHTFDDIVKQIFDKVEEYRDQGEAGREEIMKELHALERRITEDLMYRLPIWVSLALSILSGVCGVLVGVLYNKGGL